MKDKTLLRTGIIGSAIAAICCLTPALVILVSAVGASAVISPISTAVRAGMRTGSVEPRSARDRPSPVR